jgi:hypothetical protein
MDLSDPKTWTDGIAVVRDAPHIVGPLLGAVAVGVWWVRGRFVDKPMITGPQQRLDGAKEYQQYLARRLDDAQAENAKLKEQVAQGASPDVLRFTVNSIGKIVDDIAAANTDLGDKIKADPGRITWIKSPRG